MVYTMMCITGGSFLFRSDEVTDISATTKLMAVKITMNKVKISMIVMGITPSLLRGLATTNAPRVHSLHSITDSPLFDKYR